MPNVYVVTAGEYSDYCICAVFDNRQAAEAYCALGHGDYVEEYALNATPYTTDPVDYVYCFHIDRIDSNYVGEPGYILRSDVEKHKKKIKSWWNQRGNVVNNTGHIDRYVFLDENDPQLARKIVQDRIAKKKAEMAGVC